MDSPPGQKTPHILILDDDTAHQELCLRAFRDDPERYRVSITGSLRQARPILERDPPDLIIADWVLPDGKGIEILPRTDGMVTIPLIIMTSFGDERLAVEIMKSGAIDYVVKSATMFRDLPHIARRALRDWENIQERKRAEAAEQDAQKRLVDILNLLPDAVLAIDNEGRVIVWNHALAQLTGTPSVEILGKGDFEYSIPFYGERRPILVDLVLADHPGIEKRYDAIHREGETITAETSFASLPTGRGANLWVTARPLCDITGNRIGAIEVIRDITDRKRAEEILQKREATLETLLNAPRDTIALLDRVGIIININAEGAQRLGGTVQDVIGKCAFDLLPPDVANSRKTYIGRVFETGTPAIFDDGRSGMYLHNEIFPVFNTDHTRVDHIAIFARDITNQKKAELALQESEERFRRISSMISDFAYSCTRPPDGNAAIDWVSGAVHRITGYSADELHAMGCWRGIVVAEDQQIFDKKIGGLLPGISARCELRIRAKDGVIKWLLCFAECINDPADPAVYRLYGGCQDISGQKNAGQALQESETRFKDLFSNMSSGVVIYEPSVDGEDFIIRDINHAVETIEQVKKDEVLGRSVLDVFPGVKEFGLFAVFQRVARTGIAESHPVSMYRDNRISGWRENYVYRLPSGEVVALYEDVTEKKQAEEALQAAREWLGIALRAAKAGTWDWDFPSGKLTWSPEFYELFGLSLDMPASFETWLAALNPDDREPAMAKIDQSIKDHTYLWNEYRIILPDGTPRWIGAGGNTSYNSAGEPQRMSGVCIDITDRKLAEERFRESEERYTSLFNRSLDGIYINDLNGNFLDANAAALDLLGYSREEIAHVSLQTLLDPEQLEKAKATVETIVRTGTHPGLTEYRLKRKDGQLIDIETKGTLISHNGKPHAIFGIARDVTTQKQAKDLRKSYEERLDSAMEIGSLAWWEMDLPDGAVRFDGRKATMLGYSPDEFRHYTDFTSLLHPEDLKPAMQAMRDHLEGKQSRYHVDYRIRTAGGSYRWFRDVGGITLRHPDGSARTVTGIVIDITAAKQAEEALYVTENRFRALIQNSSDIIRILDQSGRVVYESASAERILGYSPGSLIGKDPFDYIHPDDVGRVRAELAEVYGRTNTGIPTEFRVRKANGEYLWVDSIGTNLLDVPGVNGIVITTRPIQQRKEAEQALHESDERLRLALEGADVASWDWNLTTGKAVFSDRFYTMLGYGPGDFPASFEGWSALIHPEERDRVLADLARQIQEKRPLCEIEYRIQDKDGDYLWILGRGKISETDAAGTPTRMTGVNIDITNRRLMESEIRSLNTVLEQRVKDRTEELSLANAALEEENAQRLTAEKKLQGSYDEKVMLLKETHHRVKNNLQIIASLLNLQSRYIKDEQTLAAIRESQNRVKAMALVHEKLYRSEDIAHISLHDYLRFLGTGLFQFYDAKTRGIQFTLDIHDVDVDIDAAIPLGLIINELISNSLKYAFPEGRKGEIAISVKKEGHTMTVLFRDTGIGIPQGLDWRNTQSLGLRLVNTLVDQMNGTVELDRTSGTVFTIVVHEKAHRGSS